jgi:hypothetical protein
MEKLFDLMLMGAKMQFVVSDTLDGMLPVTLRHLALVKASLQRSSVKLVPDPIRLLDNFSALVEATYNSLPAGAWIPLYTQLSRFFVERRVKVSSLLWVRPYIHVSMHMYKCLHAGV